MAHSRRQVQGGVDPKPGVIDGDQCQRGQTSVKGQFGTRAAPPRHQVLPGHTTDGSDAVVQCRIVPISEGRTVRCGKAHEEFSKGGKEAAAIEIGTAVPDSQPIAAGGQIQRNGQRQVQGLNETLGKVRLGAEVAVEKLAHPAQSQMMRGCGGKQDRSVRRVRCQGSGDLQQRRSAHRHFGCRHHGGNHGHAVVVSLQQYRLPRQIRIRSREEGEDVVCLALLPGHAARQTDLPAVRQLPEFFGVPARDPEARRAQWHLQKLLRRLHVAGTVGLDEQHGAGAKHGSIEPAIPAVELEQDHSALERLQRTIATVDECPPQACRRQAGCAHEIRPQAMQRDRIAVG